MSQEKYQGQDLLQRLKEERLDLQKRFDLLREKTTTESADTVMWGAVGACALAADWAFLGGFGTFLAVLSGVGGIRSAIQARQVGTRLERIKDEIGALEKERQVQPSARPSENLTNEFSPAAQKKIRKLEGQLRQLKKQIDDLRDPPKLDKPDFRPPNPGI